MKDMGLDPTFLVMEEIGRMARSPLRFLKAFFDGDKLDVVLPESRGVAFGEIGA